MKKMLFVQNVQVAPQKPNKKSGKKRKKLRSKIGAKGEYIKTIWGMGYKFEVDQK